MDKSYVLAFDQGTTSSRAILFDRAGRIHSVAQKEFQQIYPKPGWVEHDPMEIGGSQSGVAWEVLEKAAVWPGIRWPPSASPISARPRSCGTATTGRPVSTRSCGRTAARPTSATH